MVFAGVCSRIPSRSEIRWRSSTVGDDAMSSYISVYFDLKLCGGFRTGQDRELALSEDRQQRLAERRDRGQQRGDLSAAQIIVRRSTERFEDRLHLGESGLDR